MKTNQIMARTMGEFRVTQRTKDGFFNATELLVQWNNGSSNKKKIAHYTENDSTNQFINALISEEKLKGRNSVLLQSRGRNGGTWMHPLLFIDFAMWLNPVFKVKVLKFVQDEMIKFRNEAGDNHKEMASAIQKIVTKDFMPLAMKKVSEALNWIVFNQHEKMIRNKFGDEDKQRELAQFEKKITELINDGFITNFENLINYLRKQYQKYNYPSVFIQS